MAIAGHLRVRPAAGRLLGRGTEGYGREARRKRDFGVLLHRSSSMILVVLPLIGVEIQLKEPGAVVAVPLPAVGEMKVSGDFEGGASGQSRTVTVYQNRTTMQRQQGQGYKVSTTRGTGHEWTTTEKLVRRRQRAK